MSATSSGTGPAVIVVAERTVSDLLAGHGVHWTVQQAQELLRAGAPGLHFYTLNRSSATLAVHAALGI